MSFLSIFPEDQARKEYLMQQMEKVLKIEEAINRELREIIYKIEKK